jgi:hypothetical protein
MLRNFTPGFDARPSWSSQMEFVMTAQQIYLAVVVGAFSTFGVSLFAASIWSRLK